MLPPGDATDLTGQMFSLRSNADRRGIISVEIIPSYSEKVITFVLQEAEYFLKKDGCFIIAKSANGWYDGYRAILLESLKNKSKTAADRTVPRWISGREAAGNSSGSRALEEELRNFK